MKKTLEKTAFTFVGTYAVFAALYLLYTLIAGGDWATVFATTHNLFFTTVCAVVTAGCTFVHQLKKVQLQKRLMAC